MWKKAMGKDAIEKRVYIYLCLFAFANVLTVAGSNIFMGLTVAGLVHRLVRYHDDVKEVFKKQLTFWRIVGFLLLAILISLPGALEPAIGIKFFFNDYIYRLMLPIAVIFCVHEKKRLINIAICFAAAMFVNEVYVILHGIKTYPSMDRFYSLAGVMPWACLLAMAVPVSFVGWYYSKHQVIFWGCAVFGIVSVLALMINATRGAWLAATVSFVIIMILSLRDIRKILMCFLVVGVLFGVCYQYVTSFQFRVQSMMNFQERSNSERRLLWQSAVNMFKEHPATGVGFAQFKRKYQEQYILPEATERELDHAHNNFFHFLAETGLLGFGGLIALCGYLFTYAVCGWRKYHQAVYMIMLAMVLGFFLHGLTEYTLRLAMCSKAFWLSLGLCFQWININKEKHSGHV